tara:strand:- start:103290 stop:104672 length:1383 start_codon:yes stop_codon:yes gene_type:complete
MKVIRKKRFLLLDTRNVMSADNVELKVGCVIKHNANPLMMEDKSWEKRFDNLYGNVLYDESEKLYKCWYSPFIVAHSSKNMSLSQRKRITYEGHDSQEMGICYATSEDGLKWDKPDLQVISFEGSSRNNIVWRGPHGAGIFKDTRAENKSQLYKSIFQGLKTSYSEDGLSWSTARKIVSKDKIAGDTHNNVIWAPTLEKYVAFTRTWGKTDRKLEGPPTKINHAWGREVSRIESSDFIEWSRPEVVLGCNSYNHQPYAMPVFYHANTYIGLLAIHDQNSDRVWTELAWSPDTKNWRRINKGEPFIHCSEDILDYDYGCVYACAAPIFLDNEIRIYYGGSDWLHTSWRNGCLALATIRPDGFAGYEQVNPKKIGVVTTQIFKQTGQAIKITADIKGNGWLEANLFDEKNEPIAKERIYETSTDKLVFAPHITRLKSIRLEFKLNGAKIYSIVFEDYDSHNG